MSQQIKDSEKKKKKTPTAVLLAASDPWPDLLRHFRRKQGESEPEAKKAVATALREALPHDAFPTLVLEIILEFLQRFLLCGVRVSQTGDAELLLRDLCDPENEWTAATVDKSLLFNKTADRQVSDHLDIKAVADSLQSVVFLVSSRGTVCKWRPGVDTKVTQAREFPEVDYLDHLMLDHKSSTLYVVSHAGRICAVSSDLTSSSEIDCPISDPDPEESLTLMLPGPKRDSHFILTHSPNIKEGESRVTPTPYGMHYELRLSERQEEYVAWESKSGVLFRIALDSQSDCYSYSWTRILFDAKNAKQALPVGHEILSSVAASDYPPHSIIECIPLPCDGENVVSSSLVVRHRSLLWMKLVRSGTAEKPIWEEQSVLYRLAEPRCEISHANVPHEGVVVLGLTTLAPLPYHSLCLVVTIAHSEADEKLQIAFQFDEHEDVAGDDSGRVLMRLWQ
jgi:hypothetical protein